MAIEVDFFAVGTGERSGDAISIRVARQPFPSKEQFVILIDGGYQSDGEKLVKHIRDVYGTTTVDLVVSTHPDSDHANGLHTVLDELHVQQLWMHTPWEPQYKLADLFNSGRVTNTSVREALRRSLEAAHSVWSLANQKGVPVVEPFAGVSMLNGALRVVGPTRDFYLSMLPHFRGTPQPKQAGFVTELLAALSERGSEQLEDWCVETLRDGEETSAENETSTVLRLSWDGGEYLFTADAGELALNEVLDREGMVRYTHFQVPHHGSRRNVGPSVLNRLVGPPIQAGQPAISTAYVSAAQDGRPKHPSQRVINALTRRGVKVYGTCGRPLMHYRETPGRGWSPATPIPFNNTVEPEG